MHMQKIASGCDLPLDSSLASRSNLVSASEASFLSSAVALQGKYMGVALQSEKTGCICTEEDHLLFDPGKARLLTLPTEGVSPLAHVASKMHRLNPKSLFASITHPILHGVPEVACKLASQHLPVQSLTRALGTSLFGDALLHFGLCLCCFLGYSLWSHV